METLVVYDSKYGNTRTLAEAMAAAAGTNGRARLISLEEDIPDQLGSVDLLIVGGPTQQHGLSARMRQFADGIETRTTTATLAATFDTRYRMSPLIAGSAARGIAKRLKRSGIDVFVEPESFFVTRGGTPQLESGEIERAATWAAQLVNRTTLSKWCAA
jgi:flavodoxin